MRFFLASCLGKLAALVGRPFGRSTNLPGEIALRICPDLFAHFHFDGKVLAVTGSNGKTTTANMIATVLASAGKHVVNNAKGSNLAAGVATTLLCAAKRGRISADYVVLEVDERYSVLIFRHFSPDVMLVTNLFRDQLTRNGNVDVIVDKLSTAIKPGVLLVLNGNDPISSALCPENRRMYYGLSKNYLSSETSVSITHDAKVCPRCLHPMTYDFFHYNHIGSFHCEHCGHSVPKMDFFADQLTEAGDFTVNGRPAHTDYVCASHVLNCTACVAACCAAGLTEEQALEGLGKVQVNRNRYDTFTVMDRPAMMILSKNQNPVSFDRSIDFVARRPGPRTVICYVNNINHTGNRDTTWLYDVSFERLNDPEIDMVCTGPRAYDLAVRLELGGFDRARVQICPDLTDIAGLVGEKTRGEICVLTEIYDAGRILGALKEEAKA